MLYPRKVIASFTSLLAAVSTTMAIAQEPASNDVENMTAFLEEANVLSGPELVDCTLSGGTETTCVSFTVKSEPTTYETGPWCPTNISDSAEEGGIWLDGGEVYDVDGAFVENLATFYDDSNWQLFDPETGEINITDTQESCEAAARPDVDEAYYNHCVQCAPEYYEDATVTYMIPVTPSPADAPSPTNQPGSGIAFNGVLLDGPAPVEDILSAYTIAAFDNCGGHVNPHAGYHIHSVGDCITDAAPMTDHGAQIGIAMDGYQIFANAMADGSQPTDLDACNGHTSESGGYHYHAGEPGSNAILGCLSAEYGCHLEDPDGVCDASARPRRP